MKHKQNEITLKDLRKATKLIKDNETCTCKLTSSVMCLKHSILKLSKEEQKLIRSLI